MVSEYSTIWQKWPYHWAVIWVLFCTLHLTVCFYYVTYAFQSESILNSCLNVKELLPQIRRQIWSLSGRNWTQTQKHLVRKQKLNHFDKLTKWFSCVFSICLYGAFGCMFLSSNRSFRVNPHSILTSMSSNCLLKTGTISEVEVNAAGLEHRTTQFVNEHSSNWPNWPKDWAVFWVLICTVYLTVGSHHVTHEF